MSTHERRWPRVLVIVLAVAVLAAVVRLAWLSDDCYVTLRTVENVIAGHGPVWNVGERVQTYTHPSWFWLLVAARWMSGEHYFTTIVLSVVVSMLAVATLVAVARTSLAAIVVLCALLGSRAFGDFATSGLETPLVMLLLATLVRVDANTPPGTTRLGAVALLVAGCGLTRLDLLVITGPVLLAHLRRERIAHQLATVAIAATPLLGWLAFAAFYYGSPFPITAYAKVATALPVTELLQQGCRYLVITACHDPLTVTVIALGTIVGLVDRRLHARACAVGVLLSSLYVVRVGGDFMVGRFFVPAFVVSLAILAHHFANASDRVRTIAAIACLGVPWLAGTPSVLLPPSSEVLPTPDDHGVVDERRFYCRNLGLWSPHRAVPTPGVITAALRRQGRERSIVTTSAQAGQYPFVAGDLFHFVDPWLCDPLLMRLPTIDTNGWRIGHFTRAIPDGYLAALAFGGDAIPHPGLREYEAALRTVLRSGLGSAERWRTLAAWWTGRFDGGRVSFVADEYAAPPRREVTLQSLSRRCDEGTLWCDDASIRLFGRGGLRIRCEAATTAAAVFVDAVPLGVYTFVFRRGADEVGRATLAAAVEVRAAPDDVAADALGWLRHMLGVHRFEVPIPSNLPTFDAIDIDAAFSPWTIAGIGGLAWTR